MTILYIQLARVIWLVDSRELNPRGLNIVPMLAALKSRYNFQGFPTKPEEMNEFAPSGIVFTNGSFAVGNQHHMISKATLYGDGLVVESAVSTDFGEAVLADALGFLSHQFGLTFRPEMIHTKLYVSEIIAHSDKDLLRVFAPLANVWETLSSWSHLPFKPGGFGFGIDPAASERRVVFTFERQVNKPFAQGRYFSSAPLQTGQHVELLQQLEAAL